MEEKVCVGGLREESETEGRGGVMLQAESWREGHCWECERRSDGVGREEKTAGQLGFYQIYFIL